MPTNVRKELGQYFTPPEFAQLLAKGIRSDESKILELGCGNGELGYRTLSKCLEKSLYVGVEIDHIHAKSSAQKLINHKIIQGDALSSEVDNILLTYPKFDAAIGNPPYINYKNTEQLNSIVENIFPGLALSGKHLRSELVFFAKSISYLKPGATFSFILPKPLFSSDRYKLFREMLLNMVSNIEIIELPDKIFFNADVSTCILSATLGGHTKSKIKLSSSSSTGKITTSLKVSKEEAINRMDFTFHSTMKSLKIQRDGTVPTLKSEGVELKRGSRSRANFTAENIENFHTVDFPKNSNFITFEDRISGGYITANDGDILVPRVGTRILDRQVIVEEGSTPITDCVYRIRAPSNLTEKVMKTLQSDLGIFWRKAHAKGACAKFITNDNLLSLPLVL